MRSGSASAGILLCGFLWGACGGSGSGVRPTDGSAQDSPPASVLGCPGPATAAGDWKRTASVPPTNLVRDPQFADIVYGFTGFGILRSSDGLRSFCPLYRWEEASFGYVSSVSAMLAGTRRPELRVVSSTVYWGPVYVSTDYGTTWSRIPVAVEGQTDVNVWYMTIDPTTDRLYALAEDLGLIASADYGQTWQILQPNPEGGAFAGLSADPHGSGRIYVTANRRDQPSEIWSSRDSGATWDRTVTPIVMDDWLGFEVAFTQPATLYTSRWDAPANVTLRSRDGGSTFEPLSRPGYVWLHPTHPEAIYLLSSSYSPSPDRPVALSLDGGDTFSDFPTWNDSRRTQDGDPPNWHINTNWPSLFDARDPTKFIVRTDLGFFEAVVGGTVRALGVGIVPAFIPLPPPDHGVAPWHLWVDPRDAYHLLAEANGAIMESRDGGEYFHLHEGAKRFEVNLGPESISDEHLRQAFAVDAGDPDVYYLWSRTILWVGENAGRDWTPRGTGDKTVVSVDPLSPSTLYAQPFSDAPPPLPDCARWRSRDRGRTWQCLAAGPLLPTAWGVPQPAALRDFVTHPADDRVIYGFGDGVGFFRSDDGGQSWSAGGDLPLLPPEEAYYIRMLVSPSEPDRVFAVAQGYGGPGDFFEGLYASADRGATWRLATSNLGFRAALVDPQSTDTLYGDGENVPVSLDGGATWTVGAPAAGEVDLSLLAVARSTPSVVYARGAQSIFRR